MCRLMAEGLIDAPCRIVSARRYSRSLGRTRDQGHRRRQPRGDSGHGFFRGAGNQYGRPRLRAASGSARRRRYRRRARSCGSHRARCVHQGDRRPERLGARVGAGLPAPARNDRRGHRNERQDLGRRFRAADLGRARRQGRFARHARRRRAFGAAGGLAHHAGPGDLAQNPGRTSARRSDPFRPGSLLARHSATPARRRPPQCRSLYQFLARPSRLSCDAGRLSRRETAIVRTLARRVQPAVVDADSDVAAKVVAVCEKRGLRVISTGFKGTALRLLESEAENFSTRIKIAHGEEISRSFFRLPVRFRRRTRSSPPVFALPREAPLARSSRRSKSSKAHQVVSNSSAAARARPSSITRISRTARQVAQGAAALGPCKLIVVFGAAATDGEAAPYGRGRGALGDRVIVTNENPRSEDPGAIRKAILEAPTVTRSSRKIAIGLAMAGPCDVGETTDFSLPARDMKQARSSAAGRCLFRLRLCARAHERSFA